MCPQCLVRVAGGNRGEDGNDVHLFKLNAE